MSNVSPEDPGLPAVGVLGVIHEGVPCQRRDLERCIGFYVEVLGLKLLPRPERLDDMVGYSPSGAWLGNEDGSVEFHLIAIDAESTPGPNARIAPGGRHSALLVDDLDALRARLRRLGIRYEQIDGLVSSDQIFIKDPSGFTWEFQERC